MDDESDEAAVLSMASYEYFRNNQDKELTDQVIESYGIKDLKIDDVYSDDFSIVATRPDGRAVISYRGTDSWLDLLPDLGVFMGAHSPFVPAMNRFHHAFEKHENLPYKIDYVTGHSLGGTQAMNTARRTGTKAIVFNPGSTPWAESLHAGVCSSSSACEDEGKSRIFTTGVDPISFGSYAFDQFTDEVTLIKPKDLPNDWFAHSLTHFLPEQKNKSKPLEWLQPVNLVTGQRWCDDPTDPLCMK